MIDPNAIVICRSDALHSSALRGKSDAGTPNRRYFQRFYDSFATGNEKRFVRLLEELAAGEAQCRKKVCQIECRELIHIVHCFHDTLGAVDISLLFINALDPVEAEAVERGRILFEYFQMQLEATEIHESMIRRYTLFVEEPKSRERIEGTEVPCWIESRRLQVSREQRIQSSDMSADMARHVAYFQWRQQQTYQVFLFEQSEAHERLDIERLQRLNLSAIANLFTSEFRDARYHQHKYVMTKRMLSAEFSHQIMAEEATARSHILFMQRDMFRKIQGAEMCCFLGTRRNVMINTTTERRRTTQ